MPMKLTTDQIIAMASPRKSSDTAIYFLIDGKEIVYVGQSINVRSRIGEHKRENAKLFTHYTIKSVAETDLDSVERELIKKYRPKYNIQHGAIPVVAREPLIMVLTKLDEHMKKGGFTPETLATKSKGDFSNMTIRRALAGRGIDRLKAKAIAKCVGTKLEELV